MAAIANDESEGSIENLVPETTNDVSSDNDNQIDLSEELDLGKIDLGEDIDENLDIK